MRADFFLAWKYFKPKRNAVSVITLISIVGVALGVAVLMVVLAVMTGFSDKMKEKLIDTTSHAQAANAYGRYIPNPKPGIEAVEKLGGQALPVIISPILLQRGNNFIPKQMIALDPAAKEVKNFDIENAIQYGSYSLESGEMIISYLMAREMHVTVGDTILVHSPVKLAGLIKKDASGKFGAVQGAYLPREFRISGIYSFDKYDFDKNILFMNCDDAAELYEMNYGAATNLLIWTEDPYNMTPFVTELRKKLPTYNVASWQEMNARLLGVLAVEKNMQLFLLVFIVLVAAFSITNTLITTVIQKTREIGLLKAIGATSGTILRIFLLQGFFVGSIGTFFGLILGYLFIHFRMSILEVLRVVTGQEIFPREFYVFSELPAHIVPMDLVTIALISIVLCTLGGLIPALRAARL
ncbi:MAG: ABC transporter permease, partial [Lentisphaeria bacterium]|nr:ABC transporter permease [Lentisphaeria bacterium]